MFFEINNGNLTLIPVFKTNTIDFSRVDQTGPNMDLQG